MPTEGTWIRSDLGKIQFVAEQLSPVRQRPSLHAAITEACII